VNDQNWVNRHQQFLETNPIRTCKACHGNAGEGTVLSKVATKRTLKAEDNKTVTLVKGTLVHCGLCHENPV
jgi:cytochrome c553